VTSPKTIPQGFLVTSPMLSEANDITRKEIEFQED